MIAIQRLRAIKELVLQEKAVRVNELAKRFEVSEETIRRDLARLETEGLVEKNYGGAVLVQTAAAAAQSYPAVNQRKVQYYEEKRCIGAAAAALVTHSQTIILDAGSTTWCVAQFLPQDHDLSVITNCLDIPEALNLSDNSQVVMVGGKLNKRSMSLVGPNTETEIRKYAADIAFVGASGFTLERGFMSSDIYDSEIKKAMIQTAVKVVIVADHSKFRTGGLLPFAEPEQVDVLVTSKEADPMVLEALARRGVEVIVC